MSATYSASKISERPERNRSNQSRQNDKPGFTSSQILLMKRFERDLEEVMEEFELEESTYISEV